MERKTNMNKTVLNKQATQVPWWWSQICIGAPFASRKTSLKCSAYLLMYLHEQRVISLNVDKSSRNLQWPPEAVHLLYLLFDVTLLIRAKNAMRTKAICCMFIFLIRICFKVLPYESVSFWVPIFPNPFINYSNFTNSSFLGLSFYRFSLVSPRVVRENERSTYSHHSPLTTQLPQRTTHHTTKV